MNFPIQFQFKIFILAILISGCSVWQNFTTYFNLWYNISSLYEEAETEILAQKRDLFSNEPLIIPNTARNNLIKVVEKCSDLLQFNKESGYVEDALLILGKSFYYQNNFQKSKRKFEELLETNPDEDFVLQADLWIAKCEMQLKNYNDALRTLQDLRVAAIEDENDEIIKETFIEEIKYRIKQEDYSLAISLANQFVEVYDDDEVKSLVYYELGNLYAMLEEHENAVKAYEMVFEFSPDFDTEIAARIRYAKELRESDQDSLALEEFDDMRTDDKFLNSVSEIDLEVGKTLAKKGDYALAVEKLIIVDTTYKNSPIAAAASYELASLYRYNLMNYDSAGYYYSRSVLGNPPKEYQEKAKANNQLFAKYLKIRKDINRYDRQLYYALNPDIFTIDSAAYVEDSLKILKEYLEQKELEDIWSNVDTTFFRPDTSKQDSLVLRDSVFVKDSISLVDSLTRVGAFFDSSFVNQILGERQKQREALQKEKDAKLREGQLRSTVKLDSVKFKNNPPLKPKIPVDSVKTLLAKNRLELGNLFLTDLNVPDSAYNLYDQILNNFNETHYYPNSLYAMGSYYLTVNNKNKADSLFKIIYDNYKDRSIVNAAANKLNLPLIDLEYDPATELYKSAERKMLNGNADSSVTAFYNIHLKYPGSSFAPRGLYAAGYILENDLILLDSAASVYDTLIVKYPKSNYVKEVARKLTAYKQEKARIKRELESQNQIPQDSVDLSQLVFNPEVSDSLTLAQQNNLTQTEQLPEVLNQQNIQQTSDLKEEKKPTKKKLERLWNPRKHRI